MAATLQINRLSLLEKVVQKIIHTQNETFLAQIEALVEHETDFVLNPQQKAQLEQTIAECDANPNGGESWETVKARILASRK